MEKERNLLPESTAGEQTTRFHLNWEQDIWVGQEERVCKGEVSYVKQMSFGRTDPMKEMKNGLDDLAKSLLLLLFCGYLKLFRF